MKGNQAGPGGAVLVAALLVCVGAVRAEAQDAQGAGQRVDVHGFGDWVYGRTNGNQYLAGDEKGNYEDASLGLNIVATVTDRLRIVGQAEWVDGMAGTDARLDYSFAEWRVSDRLKIRAGKVKQPFGLSAEVFDVGTLRPFIELPQGVYGPIGLVGESFKGVGLAGSAEIKEGWDLSYDLYAGGQELREYLPPEAVVRGEEFADPIELEKTRDMIGARVVVETPVSGLRFGASAYTGTEIGSTHRTGLGVQADYMRSPWSLRTEYVRETVRDDLEAHGFYFEAAYHLDAHWQVAGQYDRLTSTVLGPRVLETSSLLDHKELAASINYWWNPGFVFKLGVHRVNGNRFAGPEAGDLRSVVLAGALKDKTNAVFFGAQFSF